VFLAVILRGERARPEESLFDLFLLEASLFTLSPPSFWWANVTSL